MKLRLDCRHATFRVALALAMAGMGPRLYADRSGSDGRDTRPSARQETQTARTRSQHEPDGVLTLRHALELTLLHSPELAASSYGTRAAEEEAHQAGRRANPELELEASEFGGSAARQGYDGAETTIRLSQSLELAGKRGQRHRVATSEARLSGWDYEAKRRDVLTGATKAFADVLLAQGQLDLAGSLLLLTEDMRKAAAERVKAGKVPPLEETKASVAVATARIARDRAGRDLETARKRLAAFWGSTEPVFRKAGGDLDVAMEAPPLEILSPLLEELPEVARWTEAIAAARESLALAKAARIPDVVIHAGVSRFEEDGSHAGIFGLSLPLPLLDRNTAGIAAATHRIARAECEQRAARLRALTDLAEAHNRLETTRAEASAMRAELLPAARQAFEAAQAGYREGKLGHLEVVDTQRTLGEAQARYLDVLAACRKAIADVERLTGRPLTIIHPATGEGQR